MPLEVGIGIHGDGKGLAKWQVFPETGGSGSVYLVINGGNEEVGFVQFPSGVLYDRGKAPLLARWLGQPDAVQISGLRVGQGVEYPLPLIDSGGSQLALIIKRT